MNTPYDPENTNRSNDPYHPAAGNGWQAAGADKTAGSVDHTQSTDNTNYIDGHTKRNSAAKAEDQYQTQGYKDYSENAQPFAQEQSPVKEQSPVQPVYPQEQTTGSQPYYTQQSNEPAAGSVPKAYYTSYSGGQQTDSADNVYSQSTAGGYNGDQNPNGQPSYTWSTNKTMQTAPPAFYPQTDAAAKTKKSKKTGRRTGVKVLAVFLCCVIASLASVGAFVGLIQNGVIAVNGGEESSSANPAFTINKVVDDQAANTTPVGSGVTALTKQEIAEKLIPSVVCIQVFQDATQQGYSDYLGGMFQQEDDNLAIEPVSQGSGIIYTADGYVITNAHVVSGADNLKVITSDGTTYEAELIGADSVTDLAVLKIKSDETFTPAEFGSSEDLKVADEVMAIGNPGGVELNSTVTMGYVSALDREITDSETGYTMKTIQTDAAINPGNSGGALVNMYGQVVGINSSKIASVGYEGLGFAIPVDTAQPIISDLMEYGYVKDRAMLGITLYPLDSMSARFYNLSEGLYVAQLNSDAAVNSGLQAYDKITAIDGQEVSTTGEISSYLLTKKAGDTVELTVYRTMTDETLTISLQLSNTEQSQANTQQETEQDAQQDNQQQYPGQYNQQR